MSFLKKMVLTQHHFKHTWIKPDGYDTGIKVYNCIAKRKVPFILRNKNFVSWYTCGPTVYDSAHIGHASCYVKLDIIQRILKDYFKIGLVTVMNITDIDDKIIKKSLQTRVSPAELAEQYEKEFWKDIQKLKILKPDMTLRVTENIVVIEKFVEHLINCKQTYKGSDGSIIFDLNLNSYGKLQNIKSNSIEDDASSDISNFTVWKAAKENEPYWQTSFGVGRPGWHTECAALASHIFGSNIDIHAGGIDLRFPHHENEEVQCCAYFSTPQWVNYWLHTGHLLQKSVKMSKSLHNVISIQNLMQVCDADTFRIMCLMSHYRHSMEFSDDYIKTAKKLLESYRNFVSTCCSCVSGKMQPMINKDILNTHLNESIRGIHNALIDDFDTASCLKILHSIISVSNKMLHSSASTEDYNLSNITSLISVVHFVVNTLNMFGVNLAYNINHENETNELVEVMNILIDFRQAIRAMGITNKDEVLLKLCDDVRENLGNCGIIVKDHGKISSWLK